MSESESNLSAEEKRAARKYKEFIEGYTNRWVNRYERVFYEHYTGKKLE